MNTMPSLDPVQQAQREYLESRILTAQPAELIEMLYQVAIKNLKLAVTHLKADDAMTRSAEVTRAQEAVNELMAALDHSVGAPFTQTLAALYAYVQQEILKGHTGRSEEAFRRAMGILATLEEGWKGVRTEVAAVNPAAAPQQYAAEEPETVRQPANGINDRSLEYSQSAVPVGSRDWSA